VKRPHLALALVLSVPSLAGCRGCGEEKPYTPFGTTSALPEPEPSASAPVTPSASTSAAPMFQKSVLAPAKSVRWELGGQVLEAPPGYVFEQALQASNSSGPSTTIVWLVPDATDQGPRSAGELWSYPREPGPKRLATLPGFVPAGPGCKLTTGLARTGPHTVTLDARGECAGALIARAPARALVVVAPEADRPEILSLRVALPAPGETLETAANTADRDGDGRDDVAIDVSVGAAGGPKLGAPLVWLDRAAGPSRDSAEPQRTLVRLAAREAARAKTKKLADDVVRGVAGVRRLMASLCAEGATPRVLDGDGNPLGCGSLALVVDPLLTAEVTAELARGRVLEAFGALARDGWYFGKASTTARQKVERQLLEAVEPVTALVKTLEPRPAGLERAPRFSPLAFDEQGGVLVSTISGVVRTEPDGSAPAAVADSTAPRVLDVLAAPGKRWLGTVFSCDRSEVMLALEGAPPLVTGLLSPRPGACGHSPFWASEGPPVLSAGGGELSAVVGGSLVGKPAAASTPGSARSQNQQWTVVPTSFGLLVDGSVHRLVNLGSSVTEPLRLTDCVVSDSGKSIACIHKQQAILIQIP
jgi:hypothetical protein